ncbi:MAG: hypothetical protein ABIQ11_07350 [Saprospiraceae bacterium]
MVKQIILIFLTLASGISLNAQIGAKAQQSSGSGIHGVWLNNDFGFQMTLMLDPGGSGEFDGVTFSYKPDGNKLIMTQEGVSISYTYLLQNNTLTLSGGDIEGSVSFQRSMSSGQASATDNSTQTPSVKYNDQIAQKNSNSIVGAWSGNGETMEFLPNGMVQHLGQTFPYKFTADKVTVSSSYGELIFGYTINNDKLTLTNNNGESLSYLRDSPGAAQINQQQNLSQGTIDQELVGKWCYVEVSNLYGSSSSSSSTCITLNGDGTYSYYSETSRSVNTPDMSGGTNSQNSDRGTWYVKEDRIYYNSQNQGPGSYKLEKKNHPKNVNDPMIVLDGESYVSFYNKPAWK